MPASGNHMAVTHMNSEQVQLSKQHILNMKRVKNPANKGEAQTLAMKGCLKSLKSLFFGEVVEMYRFATYHCMSHTHVHSDGVIRINGVCDK